MEWLLVVICIFLWRIMTLAKECALQLRLLNVTATEQERHLKDKLAHIAGEVSESNDKLSSVQDAALEYRQYYITPLKNHY
jgi:hypothetical protein